MSVQPISTNRTVWQLASSLLCADAPKEVNARNRQASSFFVVGRDVMASCSGNFPCGTDAFGCVRPCIKVTPHNGGEATGCDWELTISDRFFSFALGRGDWVVGFVVGG